MRESLKIGFAGGSYENIFYFADVEATGSLMNGELLVQVAERAWIDCHNRCHNR